MYIFFWRMTEDNKWHPCWNKSFSYIYSLYTKGYIYNICCTYISSIQMTELKFNLEFSEVMVDMTCLIQFSPCNITSFRCKVPEKLKTWEKFIDRIRHFLNKYLVYIYQYILFNKVHYANFIVKSWLFFCCWKLSLVLSLTEKTRFPFPFELNGI